MSFLIDNSLRFLFMLGLLFCSGFCSAAETAFFHLSPRKVGGFAKSSNRFEWLTWHLLQSPNRLLTTLLFCNLLVNILFYSLAGITTVHIQELYNHSAAALWAVGVFISLLIFGEMLPKAFAYANAYAMCMTAVLPFYFLLKILTPLLAAIDYIIIKPAVRLSAPVTQTGDSQEPVTLNQLRILLDQSARKGLLTQDENLLLLEVLELGLLKVRHVMRPRVEMKACSIHSSHAALQETMYQYRLRQIPVYTDSIDSIVGVVHFRDLLTNPDKPVEQLVKPVHFVPEQKNVESLIAFFQNNAIDIAIAVDEYGGIAGLVKLDDIVDQLLGADEQQQQMSVPIQQIGPMTYRLSARLSILDWAEAFGVDPEQIRLTTIGGLVTALLGRIPKNGDVVTWQNMKFTIETVKNNRIESLILSLEPLVAKP
ncbi:MAG: HlyC/CorC family transporter [Sedimentisphaerales bacterium]|nr:HlyC/CorC family transporter [Sedimentisphaerales bacterium]